MAPSNILHSASTMNIFCLFGEVQFLVLKHNWSVFAILQVSKNVLSTLVIICVMCEYVQQTWAVVTGCAAVVLEVKVKSNLL